MERIMFWDAKSPWKTKTFSWRDGVASLIDDVSLGWGHFLKNHNTHPLSFLSFKAKRSLLTRRTVLEQATTSTFPKHRHVTIVCVLLLSTYWVSWFSWFPWFSSNSWYTWISRASLEKKKRKNVERVVFILNYCTVNIIATFNSCSLLTVV